MQFTRRRYNYHGLHLADVGMDLGRSLSSTIAPLSSTHLFSDMKVIFGDEGRPSVERPVPAAGTELQSTPHDPLDSWFQGCTILFRTSRDEISPGIGETRLARHPFLIPRTIRCFDVVGRQDRLGCGGGGVGRGRAEQFFTLAWAAHFVYPESPAARLRSCAQSHRLLRKVAACGALPPTGPARFQSWSPPGLQDDIDADDGCDKGWTRRTRDRSSPVARVVCRAMRPNPFAYVTCSRRSGICANRKQAVAGFLGELRRRFSGSGCGVDTGGACIVLHKSTASSDGCSHHRIMPFSGRAPSFVDTADRRVCAGIEPSTCRRRKTSLPAWIWLKSFIYRQRSGTAACID